MRPITPSVLSSERFAYFIINVVATSHNSIVYLATSVPLNDYLENCINIQNSQLVVLKQVNRRQESICELQCHEFVHSHPNVLSLLDCIVHDEDMFFVLEYCPEGDLFNAIMTQNANGTLTQREREVWAMDIFRDIINSISWCHKNSVWHRDIKPENVLIASDGRALLADFGLATTYAQTYDHGVGSAIYMAPELLNTSGAWHGKTPIDSAKVDIWALGVLLINMLSGRNPWGSAHYADAAFQIYLNRPEALRETFNLSEDGWYIIKRMLAIDPYERPTIEQVSSWIDMVKSWTIEQPMAVVSICFNEPATATTAVVDAVATIDDDAFDFDAIDAELQANALIFAYGQEMPDIMVNDEMTVPVCDEALVPNIDVQHELANNTAAFKETDAISVPELDSIEPVTRTSGRPRSLPSREEHYAPLLMEIAANDLIHTEAPQPRTTRVPSLTNSLASLSDDDLDAIDLAVYEMHTLTSMHDDTTTGWYTHTEDSTPLIDNSHLNAVQQMHQAALYDEDDELLLSSMGLDDDSSVIADIYDAYQSMPIDYNTASKMPTSTTTTTTLSSTDNIAVTPSLSASSSSSSSSSSRLSSQVCTIEQPKPVYMARVHPTLDLVAKPTRSNSTILRQPWVDIKEMTTATASPVHGLNELERIQRGRHTGHGFVTTESWTPFERVGTPACA